MERRSGMKKVLCPVQGKNGKTIWMRCGTGFDNRDGSINVYLDTFPANGKLQLRAFDDARENATNENSRSDLDHDRDALPF